MSERGQRSGSVSVEVRATRGLALGGSRGVPQVALGRQSTLRSINPASPPLPGGQTWWEQGKESGWGLGIVPEPSLRARLYQSHPEGHQDLCQCLRQPQGRFSWEGKERKAKSQELEKLS